MLKELKSPQKDSSAWCSLSDKLQMAEDCLAAVRKLRREVVDCMRLMMMKLRQGKSDGVFLIVEDMLKKTKVLCSVSDTNIVEDSLTFLEDNRVTIRPEKDEFSDSVAEFLRRNKLNIDLQFRPLIPGNLQTPLLGVHRRGAADSGLWVRGPSGLLCFYIRLSVCGPTERH